MKYGFIKVASSIPAVKVGDVIFNTQQIEEQIALAEGKGVEIITFPELSITGYSCQDLFRQQMLLESSEQAVMMLLDFILSGMLSTATLTKVLPELRSISGMPLCR